MNARDTYEIRRKQVKNQVALLQETLEKLDDEHKSSPKNWGIVGTLGHTHETLAEILAFLCPTDEIEGEPF